VPVSVVQHDAQKRTVDGEFAVVMDEAKVRELVHEKTHS
jgi:hypothetical protein